MPRKATPTTWAQKMQKRPPHSVILAKDFAGVPAGLKLLISCPMEVQAYLLAEVPYGQTRPIQQMRKELAALHGADAACPVSTAIFLRIVAEHAWEQIEAGTPASEVAPFWRVIEPNTPLAKKLAAGSDWVARQRALESGLAS